ncbi:MAG: hypothetical protein K8I27_12445 [Planctomycetes bacterium]|nr:hypothetical protein [Planctomycetota bacterium]
MRTGRIIMGACILVAIAAATLGGVWVLRESGGGGLDVSVAFEDPKGLAIDDDVIYGDRIVGRVERIVEEHEGRLVTARIAAEYADLVHEGSRFWVESQPGMDVLMFDSPVDSGAIAAPGHRFEGFADRPPPDPKAVPPAVPRKLTARPVWLCEIRAVLELTAGADLTETQRRKTAGVVAAVRESGDLLVLAPSWVVEYQGDLAAERYRVELVGGATYVGEVLHVRLPFVVLLVRESKYQGNAAPFWADALADQQGLLLTDFEGTGYAVKHIGGEVHLRAGIEQGYVALIDGTNVAGFALPAVGVNRGASWVPLNGAGDAMREAQAKLE